jgi:hypothetical protein
MKYTFTIIFSFLLIGSYAQNNPRYISKVFDDHNFYQNITYEEAIPYNIEGKKIKRPYKLDFYEPFGDDAVLRPLVILFPDGDFIIGNKEQEDIVKLCQELTTYGYTCACVNYRQGYDNSTAKEGFNQAIFRAVQDGRTAIRFFIEHQEAFRINADKIFLGGYKTGAELALQTAFSDKDVAYSSDSKCLDCSGNTFNHDFSVAGVININGVLNDKTIISPKNEIAVLNITINNSESKILQTADLTDHVELSKNIENYHQYLVGLNVESYFESYEQETTAIESFVNTINQNSIKGIVNFLGKNLISQTNKPLGDTEVCENTVETYYYPEDKESKYEWIVENGTIETQKNNTVNVRWNKGRGIGKIKSIKTNLKTAVQHEISEPLDIQITSAPIADFEMEYLSSNIIKIKDNSFGANLFSIDYDFEGQMYQGNPNTNVSFSYNKDGYYNLVQTVENICGFATQTIPVEISVPIKFKSTNIENTLEKMPTLINQGDNIKLNVSTLSNSTTFNIVIRDDYNQLIKENSYIVKSMSKELLIETANLKSGIYFIEFFTDEILVMTKRVRIR